MQIILKRLLLVFSNAGGGLTINLHPHWKYGVNRKKKIIKDYIFQETEVCAQRGLLLEKMA